MLSTQRRKTNTMTRKTVVAGRKVKRGVRMRRGKGWRLEAPGGQGYKATLIERFNIGDESVAIFRVLPHPDAK
jgi:hypothetical protein